LRYLQYGDESISKGTFHGEKALKPLYHKNGEHSGWLTVLWDSEVEKWIPWIKWNQK
jgi:hypothetical protein